MMMSMFYVLITIDMMNFKQQPSQDEFKHNEPLQLLLLISKIPDPTLHSGARTVTF
jgi:hypothetical protein